MEFQNQQKLSEERQKNFRNRALWRAVILQALTDLKSESRKKMANINRVKSVLWMNLNNEDFLTVCHFASLNPRKVFEVKERIKRTNPLL